MICQLCKAELGENTSCRELYDQLAFYTLAHPDRGFFIHQLIVDAYGAQHLTKQSKAIGAAFTILGLYLFSERNYTGREVQLAHIQLAKVKREYPAFILPENRGNMNAADVLAAKDRDAAIKEWVKSAWEAFSANRALVINMLAEANFQEIKNY